MRIFVVIALVLTAATFASAQYTVVSEAEYRSACRGLHLTTLHPGKPYRITTNSRKSGAVKHDLLTRGTISYESRTRWHQVSEWISGGTTTSKLETISFDGKAFDREGDGEWSEKPAPKEGPEYEPTLSDLRFNNIEYRLFGTEQLNGREVRVCEKFESSVAVERGSNKEQHLEFTHRYWFSEDALVKQERTTKSVRDGRTFMNVMITEWDLDPNIKVTLPAKFAKQ